MAVTAPGYWYGSALAKLANKEADIDTDTIKAALVSSSYTPNRDTHDYWDDVVANEVTGTNWAANGVTLTTVVIGVVAANSWATARANTTAYTATASSTCASPLAPRAVRSRPTRPPTAGLSATAP
jgi:hypothetical protein